VPSGPAPKLLQVDDLVEGTGDAAKAGDTLTVDYVGVLYKNGKQFDASWDRGEPFQFQLGAGGVIQGWDQGLVGMKVGGRRMLTIPANLGYGTEGAPPDIPPNAPLVFVVDLKAIN
jgi:peptidylprolyl isomerase